MDRLSEFINIWNIEVCMNSVSEQIAELSFGRRNVNTIPHKFALLLVLFGPYARCAVLSRPDRLAFQYCLIRIGPWSMALG